MRAKIAVFVLLLGSLALVLMTACQTKEVTSAKVYIQQDNWDKAIEQLEQAVKLYPNDAEAYYLLGEGYGNQGKWAKMNEAFDKSLENSPTFEAQIKSNREKYWVTTFNSGVSRINGGDIEGAIKQFKTCLIIDPKRAEAYKNLAYAYTRSNNLDAAKNVYEEFLKVEPDNMETMQALASIYFQLKKYEPVVELEKKALKLEPENSDAIANLALAYDFLGKKDEAIDTYSKALAKNPDDKDLLFNLARLYYMNNKYDKAIELFQKVIKLDPNDFDSNLNVGNAYLSMGESYRKELVKKENDGKEITKEEKEKLVGFFKQSIPYLEKAKSIKPENANLWSNLGVAYVQTGNAEKGKECFDKADELKK